MKRYVLVLVALLLVPPVVAGQDLARQFAMARNTETVQGDLRAAIEQYRKVAEGSDRSLAAQALLRMAECHVKLGESEAQNIYRRLVREYADQATVAAAARTRLDNPSAAPMARARTDWSVWTSRDADGFGSISPDGRMLTYTDWNNGASLAMLDVTTGTTYRLTTGGFTEFSVISKDGRQVVYEWREQNRPDARQELRIATLKLGGISEPRSLLRNEDVTGAAPYDWSNDGAWIAAELGRKDGTKQIGLVNARDGSIRVLKSIDWKSPTKIFFSPDGRFVAYDLMVTDNPEERHVFVMAVDGSRETVAVADRSENVIMGWSPDGGHLLFSSNRTGSFGLWGMPMVNGRPQGSPTLLKPDISSSWSLGLTKTGTMFIWKYASPLYVQASSVDLAAGTLRSGAPLFHRFIVSRGRPDWSDDGKQLAYQSCAPLGAGPCTLWIRSMETGQLRELKVDLGYFAFVRWSPDGRSLLTNGRDVKGRNFALYRIDAQTGAVAVIAPRLPGLLPEWTTDGGGVTYRRGASVIERHLASGAERELATLPANAVSHTVSPDGRRIAYQTRGGSAGGDELFVVPMAGGTPRALLQLNAGERLNRYNWVADGKALIVARRREESAPTTLLLIPVDGGAARTLDIDTSRWLAEDGFSFDAAGKQVAFVAASGEPGLEIRALENFLPAR
jgi:Tol biopolymer transport system component